MQIKRISVGSSRELYLEINIRAPWSHIKVWIPIGRQSHEQLPVTRTSIYAAKGLEWKNDLFVIG